jgi:hypothetical protein
MTLPYHPHDSFFKELFSRPEAAKDFVRHYLPPEVVAVLELRSLTIAKDSFIDETLAEHYSDLLYRVQLKVGKEAYISTCSSSTRALRHHGWPWICYAIWCGSGISWGNKAAGSRCPWSCPWFSITVRPAGASRGASAACLLHPRCSSLMSLNLPIC